MKNHRTLTHSANYLPTYHLRIYLLHFQSLSYSLILFSFLLSYWLRCQDWLYTTVSYWMYDFRQLSIRSYRICQLGWRIWWMFNLWSAAATNIYSIRTKTWKMYSVWHSRLETVTGFSNLEVVTIRESFVLFQVFVSSQGWTSWVQNWGSFSEGAVSVR